MPSSGAGLYVPILNADIIDKGVVIGDAHRIIRTGAVMSGVTVVQAVSAVAAGLVAASLVTEAGRDLRELLYTRVLRLPAQDVYRFGASSLTIRTSNDVQQIQDLALTVVSVLVPVPVMFVGGVSLALGQDVPLSFFLLAAIATLVGLTTLVLRRARPVAALVQGRVEQVHRLQRERITGVRVIRGFGRDSYEEQRFDRTNKDLARSGMRLGSLTTLMLPLGTTVVNLFTVPVVWLGASRIANGGMQIGALTAFLSYFTYILTAVTGITATLMMLPRAEACAARVEEVLRTPPERAVGESPLVSTPLQGQVRLRSAGFRYPGAEVPVLDDVSLTVGRGEVLAVMGATGSGKSTLLRLLVRLLDVTHGQVLVNGCDVRSLDQARHSAAVGIVPQRPWLFSGTVASNLRYARADATDEELWRVLEIAQARDFVQAMEGGLQAPVTAGGGNVSGGQRQRLAIARTLLQRPEIYLFDDAFSALDPTTEAALRAALSKETSSATVVMVAQRVSTVRDADRIVLLDSGRVAAVGTHATLMACSPAYQETVRSQTKAQATS